MIEQSTQNRGTASGEEGDAGAATPAGAPKPPGAHLKELLDGPPPGWRAGTVALSNAGAKAEELGVDGGYERLASEDDPEGHIIRGQE